MTTEADDSTCACTRRVGVIDCNCCFCYDRSIAADKRVKSSNKVAETYLPIPKEAEAQNGTPEHLLNVGYPSNEVRNLADRRALLRSGKVPAS
jgi:hypothetical protein